MAIYSGFLRVMIHIYAAGCVLFFTALGATAWKGTFFSAASMGSLDTSFGTGTALGGAIGFIVGLFVAASVFGLIALLFEIRDSLKAIKEGQLIGLAASKRQRIDPAL